GSFGAATEAAVKAFQTASNLKADGIAGKNTVTALGLVWGEAEPELPTEPDYKALYEKLKAEAAALQTSYDALLKDMKTIKQLSEKY
ncbi:MAG: peptidoglycan-binding protein, partial [Clostridiales bacterium]|nr:peptidoglycan-binding protein [Clostridiales bacterium]